MRRSPRRRADNAGESPRNYRDDRPTRAKSKISAGAIETAKGARLLPMKRIVSTRVILGLSVTAIGLSTVWSGSAGAASTAQGISSQSARQILRASDRAFSSASSVRITGFAHRGHTIERMDLSLLSNGDSMDSIAIGKETIDLTVVGGASYLMGNAAFWKKSSHLTSAQAANIADTWIEESPSTTDALVGALGFARVARSLHRTSGALTKLDRHKLHGTVVVGVHSPKAGTLYVAAEGEPYPVEQVLRSARERETILFTGWNSQPEPVAPSTDIGVGSNGSFNWSGYGLHTATGVVTHVDAQWVEPVANCTATQSGSSSAWIGVDGMTNGEIFQTGTETDCVNGVQHDYGWFENFPQSSEPLTLAISPGDVISADIQQTSPGYWNFTLRDLTTGRYAYSINPVRYSGPEDSAEWIEEDPAHSSEALYPYANFGTVDFSDVSVDGSTPALSLQDNGITMVQHGAAVSLASPFTGNSFSVMFQ